MLVTTQTNFLGNIVDFPSREPIHENILSNFNPKSTSRLKKLKKEEHDHRLAAALVCRAWSEKLLNLYGQEAPSSTKTLKGKLHGNLRDQVTERLFKYLLESNRYGVHADVKAEGPFDGADPNILNVNGETPYSLALPLYLEHHEKYSFLMNQLDNEGIQDTTFVHALVSLLKNKPLATDHFDEADRIISRLRNNGNEKLLQEYLSAEITNILKCLWEVKHIKLFISLLKKAGVEFSIDALNYMLIKLECASDFSERRHKLECLILDLFETVRLDAKLESGDHLIHSILKAKGITSAFKSWMLIETILKKFPDEIYALDCQKMGVLSLLFKYGDDNTWECLEKHLKDSLLLKTQRDECHSNIIKDLSANFRYDRKLDVSLTDPYLLFLKKLKALFPKDNSFEYWLLKQNDTCSLLHEIAYWRPGLIKELLRNNVITETICSVKDPQDSHGHTVLEICKGQYSLFFDAASNSKTVIIDSDLYISFNKKAKKDNFVPFIFEVFFSEHKESRIRASLKSRLFKQLVKIDPQITNFNGETLLHAFIRSKSCKENNLDIFHYLIESGVDPLKLNNEEKSALNYAVTSERTFIIPFLQKYDSFNESL